jgi:hypothetical protein
MVAAAPAHSAEDQPADAFAPNIIAGTTSTVNLTTPAMEAAPKDPDEKKKRSFVPKRKKKRKPPPPRTGARKKRSVEESVDSNHIPVELAEALLLEEDVDVDGLAPEAPQMPQAAASSSSADADVTVDVGSSEAISHTKEEFSSVSVPSPHAMAQDLLINLPVELEFPRAHREGFHPITRKPSPPVFDISKDMIVVASPDLDILEMEDDMMLDDYADVFYDEPVFVPPPSESAAEDAVEFHSSLEPPLAPAPSPPPPEPYPETTSVPIEDNRPEVTEVDKNEPEVVSELPTQPMAPDNSTRPKRKTQPVYPPKPKRPRKRKIQPPGYQTFSISTTQSEGPLPPPAPARTPSPAPLITDFAFAAPKPQPNFNAPVLNPIAFFDSPSAPGLPAQRLASGLVAPRVHSLLPFPPSTQQPHHPSLFNSTNDPYMFYHHARPTSSSTPPPQHTPNQSVPPFPDFHGPFLSRAPTPPMFPPSQSGSLLPPIQPMPFPPPPFRMGETQLDNLNPPQTHQLQGPSMPFWM